VRITCVIGTLGLGGAERVMTYLAGGLAVRGHEVTLLTLDNSVPDFYPLPANVTRVREQLPTFKQAGILGGFPRLWRLTKAVRRTRPDVLISFMTISVAASCLFLRVPFIYADHLDVRYLVYSLKWKILRNWLLGKAFAVAVLSQRDRTFIEEHHRAWRPVVIYNPALPPLQEVSPRPEFMQDGVPYVVTAGRLVKQKGFDRLLAAWKQVCAATAHWRLAIIGAGEDENELKTLARTLAVQDRVDFVAPLKNLTAVFQHAQLYAMSSRAEGFPLVLLEALAAGVPAVSFNCTGPDVIIRDGTDGFLVAQDDIDALAGRLIHLMQDEPLRQTFSRAARQITGRFSLEKYLDAYENLCKDAVQCIGIARR